MPKYDAFGREIGENTLEGLGEPTASVGPAPSPSESWEQAAPPRAEPADGWTEAPAPEAPVLRGPDAAPRPIKVRRARGLGCLVSLVILAAVLAGPVIAIVSFVDDAGDAIDSVTGAIDEIPTITPIDEPPPPDKPPTGITGDSMIAPSDVAGALKRLRADGVKRVVRVTIWPERLHTEAIKGGRARDVTFYAEGGVERGDPAPVNDAFGTIPIAEISPEAPARLVRNSAKKFKVRERGINYLIASADAFDRSGHRWIAYFKNGVYVQGDEHGRVIRRIN